MKIVTGYTGTKHITSADDQARNLGIVGGNLSVLPVGSQFAPTYSDLTLTVADGDAVFQGVHCRQVGTYSATFTRPASGKYRCDVLAVRYGNTAGVESVDYVTKKGTETTSQNSIAVPSVTAGDIRGGATLAEAALFNVYMSVAGIYKVELVPPVVKNLSMFRGEMAEVPHFTSNGYAILLSTDTNINQILVGEYYWENANTRPADNMPDTSAVRGRLWALDSGGGTYYCAQICYTSSLKWYVRYCTSRSNFTWTDWKQMPTRDEVDSLISKTAITQIKTSLTDYIDALPNNMLANLWSSARDGNTVGSPSGTTYPMYYRVRKVNATTAIIEANVMGNGTDREKTYIRQKYGTSGWSDWIQS